MRRTKIVATIGPASWERAVFADLVDAGLDVARLNFSHGDHSGHKKTLEMIRSVSSEKNRHIAVMQDLCGPKVRTGIVAEPEGESLGDGKEKDAKKAQKKLTLDPGSTVILACGEKISRPGRIGISHREVAEESAPGDRIFIHDGLIELQVLEVKGKEIHCEVVVGGDVGSRKGVNLPDAELKKIPAVTEKDWKDLEWGIKNEVDYVALSFVRRPEEIRSLQKYIEEKGASIPVIAKIEKPQALQCMDEIVRTADGVMVARGDLGVELPPQQVPLVQKDLIALAMEHERPVITATQMLESMNENKRPTRAEVSDVANAIFDGTDAVMLSGETASGKYPVDALKTMADIAGAADEFIQSKPNYRRREEFAIPDNVGEAIGRAAELIARDLELKAIFVPDVEGSRARAASASRPDAEIYGISWNHSVLRRMALLWGVTPVYMVRVERGSELITQAQELALEKNIATSEEWIVIMTGSPHDAPGPVNSLRLHQIP